MAANIKIWWPVVRLLALCTLRLAAEYQRFPSPFDEAFLYPPSLPSSFTSPSPGNGRLRPREIIPFDRSGKSISLNFSKWSLPLCALRILLDNDCFLFQMSRERRSARSAKNSIGEGTWRRKRVSRVCHGEENFVYLSSYVLASRSSDVSSQFRRLQSDRG